VYKKFRILPFICYGNECILIVEGNSVAAVYNFVENVQDDSFSPLLNVTVQDPSVLTIGAVVDSLGTLRNSLEMVRGKK
jgi:hypothetical protein